MAGNTAGTGKGRRKGANRPGRPNILFIMADDHAAQAMSCYGSRINSTPNLDRIAREGMRFDNCFCTNSICTPSRAVILTGTHSHVSRVTTLATPLDSRLTTFPMLLRDAGYRTAMLGKWHLHSVPAGYDHYSVLNRHWGHGTYFDPHFLENGVEIQRKGHITDILTGMALDWLGKRDRSHPFCLFVHHKAPHRSWFPAPRHEDIYRTGTIPFPANFNDDYSNRARAAAAAEMRIDRNMVHNDIKVELPPGVDDWTRLEYPDDIAGYSLRTVEGETVTFRSHQELKDWKYQRYMRSYLGCVAGIDESTGTLLRYLDEEGLADDTIVVYTSDQGFFLGEHGWFDKRFMYEESLRMPFVVRYPKGAKAGSVNADIVLNLDFARTFLDFAGVRDPGGMQGRSFRPLLEGHRPPEWRESMYYRYWMHGADHNVFAHYGVRTKDMKLVYYYGDGLGQQGALDRKEEPEWEMFDLGKDPAEMRNVVNEPSYSGTVRQLKDELHRLQSAAGDERYPADRD